MIKDYILEKGRLTVCQHQMEGQTLLMTLAYADGTLHQRILLSCANENPTDYYWMEIE